MVMLVVDNDDCFCRDLINSLKSIESNVLISHDQVKALYYLNKYSPKKIVVEQHLESVCGFELIGSFLKIDKSLKIIMLSRYGCIADAVKAVKLGAVNYLPKPVTADVLNQAFETSLSIIEDNSQKRKKPMSIKRFEWEYINTVLANKKGNISATARELGLDRRTLQRKLKKFPCLE